MGSGDCGQLGLGPTVLEKAKLGKLSYFDGLNIVLIRAGGLHCMALSQSGKVASYNFLLKSFPSPFFTLKGRDEEEKSFRKGRRRKRKRREWVGRGNGRGKEVGMDYGEKIQLLHLYKGPPLLLLTNRNSHSTFSCTLGDAMTRNVWDVQEKKQFPFLWKDWMVLLLWMSLVEIP